MMDVGVQYCCQLALKGKRRKSFAIWQDLAPEVDTQGPLIHVKWIDDSMSVQLDTVAPQIPSLWSFHSLSKMAEVAIGHSLYLIPAAFPLYVLNLRVHSPEGRVSW